MQQLMLQTQDHRKSQCDRILALLREAKRWAVAEDEGWVPLPNIMRLGIASHTRRIHELRERGFEIAMRDEWTGRERHTAYKLTKEHRD